MKIRQLLLGFVVLLALSLVACSPKAESIDSMSNNETESADTMEIMEDKEADMMEKEEEDSMSDNDEGMSAQDSDDMVDEMMEEKDDDVMMGENDNDMITDKNNDMEDHNDDSMMENEDSSMSKAEADDMSDNVMMTPDWFKASLIDVNSGESFAIADFKGKIILVETLAMWCSNCLKQQGQVQSLHDLVGERDDFVSLGIDIDPNEDANALKAYITNNGFDWLYTVASTEVAREIGQLYGDQFLNPPSTPMLIIDKEGIVHLLPFGIKSAEDLYEAVKPFLDVDM